MEEYQQNFQSWEVPLYNVAHEHGLAADQVHGLRDAAVELGQAVSDTGRLASEEDLKKVFDKYHVASSARMALTRLWRSVEGGGAS